MGIWAFYQNLNIFIKQLLFYTAFALFGNRIFLYFALNSDVFTMKTNLPQKRYYSIGEVAKAFDVNTSLIRFWEKEFAEISPKKTTSGKRKFTPQDIEQLELIYHLVKERGFTLDGARVHLKENKKKVLEHFDLIQKLENVKIELQKLKDTL